MAREVFFTADDFGLDHETNLAIIAAHTQGALHGAALMMGQPGTTEAITLARQYPSLQVGWHLHLCDSQPITVPHWPWGSSPARAGWAIGLLPSARRLMKQEVKTQWQLYRDTGLPCAFFNTHHHLHLHPMVWKKVIAELGEDFPGWIRLPRPCYFDHTWSGQILGSLSEITRSRRKRDTTAPFSDTLWGLNRIFLMQAAEVRATIPLLPEGFHEFMFHPRRLENDLDLNALRELKNFSV
jgi:predicted glycoside hydrolase/deacetylase ChbG (UPF0249 family)